MEFRRVGLMAMIACAACSSKVAPDQVSGTTNTHQSGARLRAHVYEAGGGATSFIDRPNGGALRFWTLGDEVDPDVAFPRVVRRAYERGPRGLAPP